MKISKEYFQKLNNVFNKYAGKEIAFTAEVKTFEGNDYTLLTPVDQNDPVVAGLCRETERPQIAFILKDENYVAGTQASYPVLEAFVEKGQDGKYRLTKDWSLGMRRGPRL